MKETIVVQDADGALLDVLNVALELEGFTVIPVMRCDEQILELIDEKRPHTIVLDYKLAGTDCIEICQRIKSRYPHLPVIALSCNANIHEQYAKEGFDDYIRKPFDLDLLYKVIKEHFPKGSIPLETLE